MNKIRHFNRNRRLSDTATIGRKTNSTRPRSKERAFSKELRSELHRADRSPPPPLQPTKISTLKSTPTPTLHVLTTGRNDTLDETHRRAKPLFYAASFECLSEDNQHSSMSRQGLARRAPRGGFGSQASLHGSRSFEGEHPRRRSDSEVNSGQEQYTTYFKRPSHSQNNAEGRENDESARGVAQSGNLLEDDSSEVKRMANRDAAINGEQVIAINDSDEPAELPKVGFPKSKEVTYVARRSDCFPTVSALQRTSSPTTGGNTTTSVPGMPSTSGAYRRDLEVSEIMEDLRPTRRSDDEKQENLKDSKDVPSGAQRKTPDNQAVEDLCDKLPQDVRQNSNYSFSETMAQIICDSFCGIDKCCGIDNGADSEISDSEFEDSENEADIVDIVPRDRRNEVESGKQGTGNSDFPVDQDRSNGTLSLAEDNISIPQPHAPKALLSREKSVSFGLVKTIEDSLSDLVESKDQDERAKSPYIRRFDSHELHSVSAKTSNTVIALQKKDSNKAKLSESFALKGQKSVSFDFSLEGKTKRQTGSLSPQKYVSFDSTTSFSSGGSRQPSSATELESSRAQAEKSLRTLYQERSDSHGSMSLPPARSLRNFPYATDQNSFARNCRQKEFLRDSFYNSKPKKTDTLEVHKKTRTSSVRKNIAPALNRKNKSHRKFSRDMLRQSSFYKMQPDVETTIANCVQLVRRQTEGDTKLAHWQLDIL